MGKSKQERLKEAIENTAGKLESTAKGAVDKVTSKVRNRARGGGVIPHKHCRICGITIPHNVEKRICKDSDCILGHEKEEKTRGRLRIWLMVFGSFFILGVVGPIMQKSIF